jgi:RNA 2',3'-cyclic 3'-phosphodiesterase
MRMFVGIPMGEAATEELSRLVGRLRGREDGLRWSRPESWHVTLQFLGSVSEAQYGCVVERLRGVRVQPVFVRLDGVGMFERAGVFFAGVKVSPELIELQESVVEVTGPCGFVAEERAYRPHVTLARSRGREGAVALRGLKERVREVRFSGFVADEFVLYESLSETGGSRYLIRERFGLGSS